MIYTTPDYYNEFKCTADKCKDTCCAGWQIVVDKESIEKYKKINSPYLFEVMARVDWETETFRQDKEKRCAFLNESNLCNLYINVGEGSLCKTCREYPRHTEEFEGVREISLSISCPEVARILMERTTPVHFPSCEEPEVEETEDFGEFDPFFFSILTDARKEMITILQNRELPLKERAILVLGMAHDMQGRINRQDMFACEQVIAKYTTAKARTFVHNHLRQTTKAKEEEVTLELFNKLYELEQLRDNWDATLRESQTMLFFGLQTPYAQLRKEFEEWKSMHSDIDIHLEQIGVYFLFTYFPGAVYDGEVFAKAQMAIYCTWMIELLWMGRWLLNGRKLKQDEMTELVYRFSREIEHSDENLKHLDKIMKKKWIL